LEEDFDPQDIHKYISYYLSADEGVLGGSQMKRFLAPRGEINFKVFAQFDFFG
jgi:hypothetical protein